ncbi:MAG: LD-carboxypeptidase [Bacteroidetes bacterium]|nr:LD-carboxypeptidase [Bacteroidota bacterium]
MNLIIPPYLKTGDTIGIAASARKVNRVDIELAQNYLVSQGFKVKLASNIYAQYFQFAGKDNQRAAGIQELLDDKEVKAIIFARGGYGSVRIIDQIDFSSLKAQPKWLVGFSDITVFHSRLQHLNVASIHGVMATNLGVLDQSSGFYVTDDSKSNILLG